MRVVYPLVEPVARVPPTEEQLAQLGYVRGIALRLEGEGYRVVNVTVQHASAPDAIVDLSADVPGALVAVSTANAGALVETIEGSTAAQILRGSSVPVIVARQT
jgi:nucleotide-binding universal stress UspA family protein